MTAQIVTDSGGGPVVGSAILLGSQVNTPVLLTNLNNTGVLGWKWEVIDAPPESPTLYPLPAPVYTSSHTIAPDIKGQCVLVRLTTYLDAALTILDDVDQVVIGVRFDPPFDWLIPAAGQTLETSSIRGWAQDVNKILREAHEFMEGGGGGGAPRLIADGRTHKIQPNKATLFREEIRITDGEMRVEGELLPVNTPRHFMPTEVPARTRLIIPANEAVFFTGVLPVKGVLTVRGLLKDITSPPPLTTAEVQALLAADPPGSRAAIGAAAQADLLTLQAQMDDAALSGTVQTTNATPTTIATYTTATNNRVIALRLKLLARDSGNSWVGHWVTEVTVARDGVGVLTVVEDLIYKTYKDNINWDYQVNVSGANVTIDVVGDVGNTIEWRLIGSVSEHG